MLNLESRPLFLTMSLKTPSAAGLLHMLPRQMKRTEKGLVVGSVSAAEGAEAMVDLIKLKGLLCLSKLLKHWTENGNFLRRKGEGWWQNCNFGVIEEGASDEVE